VSATSLALQNEEKEKHTFLIPSKEVKISMFLFLLMGAKRIKSDSLEICDFLFIVYQRYTTQQNLP